MERDKEARVALAEWYERRMGPEESAEALDDADAELLAFCHRLFAAPPSPPAAKPCASAMKKRGR